MDQPSLSSTALAAGQTLRIAVDAGTVLVAVQGRLRVDEAPRWLAGQLVAVGQSVAEGQAYVAAQPGWLGVTAQGAAALLQVAAPAPAAALPWRRWWARLRPAGVPRGQAGQACG